MRLVWHQRPHLDRKLALAEAFGAGLPKSVDYEIIHGFERIEECDWVVLFGIGGLANTIYHEYRQVGRPFIFIDKGYTRNTGHYRVSVREHQPLSYFQAGHKSDRWDRLGIGLEPYRNSGDHILFDGASNKFCMWKDLGDWQEWGQGIVNKIAQHTTMPILYRPRPRHHHETKRPIGADGAELSVGPLDDALRRAAVVVSYGGSIAVDAVLSGVPHFAIGDSIARPLSETDWREVDVPHIPAEAERMQWCCDLAYQQWLPDEFASGEAWSYIKTLI